MASQGGQVASWTGRSSFAGAVLSRRFWIALLEGQSVLVLQMNGGAGWGAGWLLPLQGTFPLTVGLPFEQGQQAGVHLSTTRLVVFIN